MAAEVLKARKRGKEVGKERIYESCGERRKKQMKNVKEKKGKKGEVGEEKGRKGGIQKVRDLRG